MNAAHAAAAARRIKGWRENPVQYVHETFGVEPDRWQHRVLEVFPSMDPKHIRIAMKACAGPGKSAVLAWCGWNFLSCYGDRDDHPKGAAVSVTGDNLADNLWPEFAKWQGRDKIGYLKKAFTWQKSRIYANDHPETWFISARSFAKTADPEEQGRTLSGLHSRYVLYLIDESGDITPQILKAAEQGLGTADLRFAKILQAGNPTSLNGMLYAAVTTLAHLWFVVTITGDPDDLERSPRIDLAWARQQIETYGRDNPWVMSFILGKFPPSSINKLLGPDEVEAAMKRIHRDEAFSHIRKALGVDVARFGDDRTVLFPRQGLSAFRPVEMRNATGPDIAARVAIAMEKWSGNPRIFIDGTGGFGASAIDSLAQGGYAPHEINFSGKAIDPRYFNKRAEMWFKMAEWVKGRGALPDDSDLKRELTAPTYTFHKGQFRIEEKDQIKSRLKFSPDKADALVLTFALPDVPAPHPVVGDRLQRTGKAKSDWDPLDPNRG